MEYFKDIYNTNLNLFTALGFRITAYPSEGALGFIQIIFPSAVIELEYNDIDSFDIDRALIVEILVQK